MALSDFVGNIPSIINSNKLQMSAVHISQAVTRKSKMAPKKQSAGGSTPNPSTDAAD